MDSCDVPYPLALEHFIPTRQIIRVACPHAVGPSNMPAGHAVPASENWKQIFTERLSALSTLVNRHFYLHFPVQTEQKPQPFRAHQPP